MRNSFTVHDQAPKFGDLSITTFDKHFHIFLKSKKRFGSICYDFLSFSNEEIYNGETSEWLYKIRVCYRKAA